MVTLEVAGTKTAHVTYWKEDGSQFSRKVDLPYRVRLSYRDYAEAMAPFVHAQQTPLTDPHTGKLACTIRVDGKLVAAEEHVPASGYERREVKCTAPKERCMCNVGDGAVTFHIADMSTFGVKSAKEALRGFARGKKVVIVEGLGARQPGTGRRAPCRRDCRGRVPHAYSAAVRYTG